MKLKRIMKVFLKILVYFAALFIIAFIQLMANKAGIRLGAIPSVILFVLFFGGAVIISKRIY